MKKGREKRRLFHDWIFEFFKSQNGFCVALFPIH